MIAVYDHELKHGYDKEHGRFVCLHNAAKIMLESIVQEVVFYRTLTFGGDVAGMWRGCGGDVAGMWRGCGGDVAGDLFERGLCLPSGSSLTEDELGRVVGVVRGCGPG